MFSVHRDKRFRQFAYVLITIGVAAAVAAVVVVVRGHDGGSIHTPGTDEARPSSVKPSSQAVASYTVAADLPKYITIPSIDVPMTRVFGLGTTKNNQIAVPNNIYDAGWYDKSSKPGQAGAMFIYGHVSSWQAKGIFYNLKKLKPGDTIEITKGDGTQDDYKVATTKIYPYDHVDMNQVLAPIDASRPALNLMTCTGQVIKGTSEFNERLVVFASLQ